MAKLSKETLRGVWAGITVSWDEDFGFNEEIYAQNVQRMIDAGAHGIYTTGSTGEFYAFDYDEFCRMVDVIAELAGGAGVPLQIGCCSDATHKTIRLLEYAASKSQVGAVQVNLPYWMRLTNREVVQFFADLSSACASMPLVHYNIPRAKRFLHAEDYLKILEVAPNLIGVKYTFAGSHFDQLQENIRLTPELSYFVRENVLVSAMQLAARGSYSSLIATNPAFMLEMYVKAEAGLWDEALAMQRRAAQFVVEIERFVTARGDGVMDPVSDKGLGVAAGCVLGHQRCRPPYIGWSDQTVLAVRAWLRDRYPEFMYPR